MKRLLSRFIFLLVIAISLTSFISCSSSNNNKSSSQKKICCICSKEASITYKGNYYCYKHYEAMKLYEDLERKWPN